MSALDEKIIAETAVEAAKLYVQEYLNDKRHKQLVVVAWAAVGVSSFGSLLVLADFALRLAGK